MQENYELVQKGFRILHPLMAGYIGREFNRVYHNNWWQEVLDTLSDQLRDLPDQGGSKIRLTFPLQQAADAGTLIPLRPDIC